MTTTGIELSVPTDEPVIRYRRFVKAPPELMFAMWTEPEHLRNWWGPRELELVLCEVDLRVGGATAWCTGHPTALSTPSAASTWN